MFLLWSALYLLERYINKVIVIIIVIVIVSVSVSVIVSVTIVSVIVIITIIIIIIRIKDQRSRKTSTLRLTGLCEGNSSVTASNAENISIWWRHHDVENQQVQNIVSPIDTLPVQKHKNNKIPWKYC